MVQKRPFEDEETLGVSSKHPKQVGHGERLFSSLESVFSEVCLAEGGWSPQVHLMLNLGF